MAANETPTTKPRRKLSRRKKLLFTALLFGVPLLTLELIYRVREGGGPPPQAYAQPDPYRGQVLVPNADFPAGTVLPMDLRTNSMGHRSPELTLEKPPGVFRIACLGGSTTWGFGASANETTYPSVLQRRLTERGHRVEVLNAGVFGWTSRKSFTNYQLLLEPYDFDLVILLHNYNDLQENAHPFYVKDSFATQPAEVRRDPSLLVRVMKHSAAYRFMQNRIDKHLLRHNKQQALTEEGHAAFERNMRALVRYLRGKGVQVLICTYPHIYVEDKAAAAALFPDSPGVVRTTLRFSLLDWPLYARGLDRHNATIREIASSEHIPLVDLAAQFPKDSVYYVDFIHHNDAGQTLKADLIGRALEAAKLLP